MAALVEGQQYGLSSQGNYSNNKSLIFVKLTDSALKSIVELINSGHKLSMCPTIQFQGNQGVISLPRPPATNSEHVQEFGFTLSNVEADSPQGSFECIQQSGARSLHSLGCMLHKMHIHANEDSYEKTRVKMASVEKESKMNCTKEIKASGPYSGRKVKVKRPKTSFIPPPKCSTPPPTVPKQPIPKATTVTSHHMPTTNSLLGNQAAPSSNHQSTSSRQPPQQSSSVSNNSSNSSNNSGVSPSRNPAANFRPVTSAPPTSVLSSSSSAAATVPPNMNSASANNSLVLASSTSTTNPGAAQSGAPRTPGNPELMKKSYRERVIHLLAIRSYKKPELLARLMKDGIKEKDRKGLSVLLSKVAVTKGNTFSLARYCWNEVQDDWTFYTKEEKELLKRRRSQIASPARPMETDHLSPAAIHSSHSPSLPNSQSQKRPHPAQAGVAGQVDYDVHQQPKKQRISHYNSRAGESNCTSQQQPPQQPLILSNPSGGSSTTSTVSSNNRLGDSMPIGLGSAKAESNSNRHSGAANRNSPSLNSPVGGGGGSLSAPGGGLFRTEAGRSPAATTVAVPSPSSKESSALSNRTPTNSQRSRTPTNVTPRDSLQHSSPPRPHNPSHSSLAPSHPPLPPGPPTTNGGHPHPHRPRTPPTQQLLHSAGHQKSLASSGYTNFEPKKMVVSSATRENNNNSSGGTSNGYRKSSSLASPKKMVRHRLTPTNNGGSTGSRGSSPQSSPESQDSVEYTGSSLNSSPATNEVPDYQSKYEAITNREQRAKYKADFNSEYNEYRQLHAAIEKVKTRFERLEYDLHNSKTGSQEWHRIKDQILHDYEESNRGHQYSATKRRLNYLHEKLSHIKRLVVDFDQSVPLHDVAALHIHNGTSSSSSNSSTNGPRSRHHTPPPSLNHPHHQHHRPTTKSSSSAGGGGNANGNGGQGTTSSTSLHPQQRHRHPLAIA